MRIAVIGSGISGITAAHVLSKGHEVALFEKDEYLGGHTNTRMVADPRAGKVPIDTGFIVCNARNYPKFYRLLRELGITLRDTEMSFSFDCHLTGFQYKLPRLRDFFAVPQNIYNHRAWRLFVERRRFNRRMLQDLQQGVIGEVPLGHYLAQIKAKQHFCANYLAPLMASIWSSPDVGMEEFPAATFAAFFRNHGMLDDRRPQWQTVVGGSHAYIKAFQSRFQGRIELQSGVRAVSRSDTGVTVHLERGTHETFDHVVIATHADQALKLLSDASDEERCLLDAWRYSRNHAALHTDVRVMPRNRRLWASWNYARLPGSAMAPVSITYYMNRLQGLRAERDYFVTLNGAERVNPEKIVYQVEYSHPIFTPAAVNAQQGLRALHGKGRIAFCGAHLGYGFHEDGVVSALDAVAHLGSSV